MLESTQQIEKNLLDYYYVINHQWFRLAYIILYNLQNTNSQILPTNTPLGNPVTDYQQKKNKNKKNSKHICKHLLGILVGFSLIV